MIRIQFTIRRAFASASKKTSTPASASPSISEAHRKMLEAEIANVMKFKADIPSPLAQLLKERRLMDASASGAEITADSPSYNAPVVEEPTLLKFSDMSNELFRKHHGPELLYRSAAYYRVFDDVLPVAMSQDIKNGLIGNLNVQFKGASIQRGNIVSPVLTMNAPSISFKSEESRLYSFMCIDADTPLASESTMIPSMLWYVANVSVSSDGSDMASGNTVIPYTPLHPFRGVGFHRYVWLALEQTDKVDSSASLKSLHESHRYDAKSFLGASDLKLRGMTFHRASWCQEVSKLYEKGRIRVSSRFATANKIQTGGGVAAEEPIFGKPLDRSWQAVTQRLYKYAYK